MTESNKVNEALHKILSELTSDMQSSNQSFSMDSNSFVFLDSKTINMVLLYILMNKELQLSRLANRQMPIGVQDSIVKSIDKMIQENKTTFDEILNELKK